MNTLHPGHPDPLGMAPKQARMTSRRRSVVVWALLVLASVLTLVASLTIWSKRQLLDTDKFTSSSAKLLADDEIRSTLSTRLADLFDERVDVTTQLQQRFPRAQSVVPVVAAAVENAVSRVVENFLASAKAQELWERTVRAAHGAVVNVLEGNDAGPVSTVNGDVVLDLRPFIAQVATRLGVEDRLKQNASPTSGEIVILKSDQLAAAQDGVRILKALSILLVILVLALYAVAVYLARGRRRRTLQYVGAAFLIVGILLILIRRVVGNYLVDSLVKVESSKPAVHNFWLIETDLLRDLALALLAYGLLAVVAGFVAGPSRAAVRLRRWIAPTFRERPVLVYSIAAFVYLVVIALGPTGATRRLIGILLLGGLIALGLEVWRRQILREFPEGATPQAADGQLDGLERLARLRSSGAITESEFEAQKAALLGT
jgi:Short C-terminal domain